MLSVGHLDRVTERIGAAVLEFCRHRVGARFHMDELCAFVQLREHAAPDSPSRILRYLRARRLVGYKVINRRESLYWVLWARR
jgi:hypothetical protein